MTGPEFRTTAQWMAEGDRVNVDAPATQGTGQPDADPGESQPISAEDFRRFQSRADQRLAQESRRGDELQMLNDDLTEQVASLTERFNRLESQAYDSDDPRVVEARKELDSKTKALRDAEGRFKQFAPRYRQTLINYHAIRVTGQQSGEAFEKAKAALSRGRTDTDIEAMADNFLAMGQAPPVRRQGSGPEVDTGRSAARGGEPRMTRALVEANIGDREWRQANRAAIAKAMSENGGTLPDR